MSVTAGFVRAVALHEIEEGLPLAVAMRDGRRMCLVRSGNAVYAVDDRCPHRDFAISGGDLVEPCVLECPWHGARFDVRTGAVLSGPSTDDLGTYPVEVSDGAVFVGPRHS